MLEIKTVKDAQHLVGLTFGSGSNARVVSHLAHLQQGPGFVSGSVYWGRPGGATRKLPQFLSYFVEWVNKTERDAELDSEREPVKTIQDVENFLSSLPEDTVITGFVSRKEDEYTISFKLA